MPPREVRLQRVARFHAGRLEQPEAGHNRRRHALRACQGDEADSVAVSARTLGGGTHSDAWSCRCRRRLSA